MRSMITAAELRNDLERDGRRLTDSKRRCGGSEDISESEQIRQALNEWLKKRGALKVTTERKRVSPRSRS
jgi:hypothetical protein